MEIQDYIKATSLEEAYSLLLNKSDSVILGGGAWLKLSAKTIEQVIDLAGLNLDTIEELEDGIKIGAMVTLRTLEQHPTIKSVSNGFLSESLAHIMGVPFRNIATVGGSIMGRYAFSDFLTPLLTFDTTLYFHHAGEMSLLDFLSSKGKMKDILTHIKIDHLESRGFFKKVSNTRLDFSMLNIAVRLVNHEIRIALGSRPGVAQLAIEAMEYLKQADPINDEVIQEAAKIVDNTMKFGTNQRASEAYRKQLAKTYVARGIKEVTKHES